VPVTVKTKKGEVVVDKDEHIRADTTVEVLSKLIARFEKDGTVTAGNASGINDGAAAVVVASAEAAQKAGLKPIRAHRLRRRLRSGPGHHGHRSRAVVSPGAAARGP